MIVVAPTLSELSPKGQAICLAYYEAGLGHGIAIGRREAEREATARWAGMREFCRHLASTPSYADLAERRGEPDRAARQREQLAVRGIAAEGVVA